MRHCINIFAIAVASMLLWSCYIGRQAFYFLKDQENADPVTTLREESALTSLQQNFFEMVACIRHYGIERLGLPDTEGYTLYVATEKEYLVDVVSAAKDTSFERHYWWYPVVGRLPYKGFYRREDAEREAKKIKAKGYDVIIRHVDSFSTHGRFPELLYTFMEDYSEIRIAELIFHEMAHGLLWLRGHAQFNEEFAGFVGEQGSLEYLVDRYGQDSDELHAALLRKSDRAHFLSQIDILRKELEALYGSGLPRERILEKKQDTIQEFQTYFLTSYDEHFSSDAYRGFSEISVNNAYLDLFATYHGNSELFFELHARLEGSLAHTISVIKEHMTDLSSANPYEILEMLR